jgi:hypothetical protein
MLSRLFTSLEVMALINIVYFELGILVLQRRHVFLLFYRLLYMG